VAVVDDELSIRETLAHHLKELGYIATAYPSADEAWKAIENSAPNLVITDLRMPGMSGLDLLRKVHERHPSTEVVIITAHADKDAAIEALRHGAFDFFEKPVRLSELTATLERTIRYQTVRRERDQLAAQLSAMTDREAQRWGVTAMIGTAHSFRKILGQIRILQQTDSTSVLLTGESGTGKELVARAIHFGSGRSSKPFIAVNCSAVPGELAESELFGHMKGSFTGATADRKGCFTLAHTGTLFLDEIGDMPGPMQAKLLRVLEDGVVTPVGATTGSKVNVRVIAATNADLAGRMSNGRFRQDLYYRLAHYTVTLPPLRERKSDIPVLAQHFAKTLAMEMGRQPPGISKEAFDALECYPFPGNVRELRNMLERAILEVGSGDIRPEHLHFLSLADGAARRAPQLGPSRGPSTRDSGTCTASLNDDQIPVNLKEAETILIKRAMTMTDGNVSAAARLLGIHRTKLHRRICRT
jgi:DNA-binding NtrC family response regulator